MLQRLALVVLLGITCSEAQNDIQALNDLKTAHADSRTKLSEKWANDQPEVKDILCAKPANAGHVVKNPNVQDSPTIVLSRPAIANLKDAGVPVFTACQVRLWGGTFLSSACAITSV